jgi:hypothetical protein
MAARAFESSGTSGIVAGVPASSANVSNPAGVWFTGVVPKRHGAHRVPVGERRYTTAVNPSVVPVRLAV